MKMTMGLILAAGVATAASADIRITEFQYQGVLEQNEFFELTNVGNSAIDLTGWSYDDDSRAPGTFDLSAFGVVAAGESVIVTELDADSFRTIWNLSAAIKVIGNLSTNLGRNDEINIFDAGATLVDRITYGDQNFPGSHRPRFNTANVYPADLGTNNIYAWVAASVGDDFGSFAASTDDVGNPGFYIPAPSAVALLGVAMMAGGRRRR